MTELQGVYRTSEEHIKADDVEVDFTSCVLEKFFKKSETLKETTKRAVKPESDKDSFIIGKFAKVVTWTKSPSN